MRTDLNKLLCERERRGSSMKYKDVRRNKKYRADTDPVIGGPAGFEGISRRYGYENKDFNENLNPLYHQVRKAVGKPFNKFYSELSKVFDKRSVINQHILQHLYQFLEKEVFVDEEGKLVVRSIYGGERYLKDTTVEFYIDPRDGIIKKNKGKKNYRKERDARKEATRKEQEKTYRMITPTQALGKIKDNWYILDLVPVPDADPANGKLSVMDVYLNKSILALTPRRLFANSRQTHFSERERPMYHYKKRAAPKKLLRIHGIR